MNKMSLLNFDIEDTGIYKIKQNKSGTYRKRIANPAYVEKVIANIEKDTILFVVRYKNYGDWKSLQISQGKLHKSHLEFFMSKGLDISIPHKMMYLTVFWNRHNMQRFRIHIVILGG
ncbi:hypothetical protein [Shouchella miscanthi]|uniref:Uncharacterized protein n=1 Tax=Shouchella miscanthi TaxID=2598861 RepID=A0ABU6NT01_9BACI|nr:hypothetical protein [Shouchella miscanthi]